MWISQALATLWITLTVVSNASSLETANNSWGVWGNWTESCLSTCGSNVRGIQTRERSCTVGTSCSGESVQTRTSQCVVPACPEGNWRFWEEWTETCSATCGSGVTGMKSRTRTCNDPSGTDCPGPSNQTEVSRCSLQACTVNGSGKMAFQTPLLAVVILTNLLAYLGR